jgi:hypothetical protein
MSTHVADFENPYASPQSNPIAAELAAPAERPGSLLLIIGGFVLLLVGYLASNLFAIADLYGLGMGPNDEQIPSPLASVLTTPAQQWIFYFVTGSAFVAGAVMLGSQRFNPLAVVCYVMCPIAGLVFMAGWPLRTAKRGTDVVAAGFLLLGSVLAFTGGTRLYLLYGHSQGSFEPVGASLLCQIGVALMIGSLLKFIYANHAQASVAGR